MFIIRMMKNYDQSVEINLNRILIIGGLGSGKINVLLNLIKNQRPDIDKIYLYVNDPFESKYQSLIKEREKARIESL